MNNLPDHNLSMRHGDEGLYRNVNFNPRQNYIHDVESKSDTKENKYSDKEEVLLNCIMDIIERNKRLERIRIVQEIYSSRYMFFDIIIHQGHISFNGLCYEFKHPSIRRTRLMRHFELNNHILMVLPGNLIERKDVEIIQYFYNQTGLSSSLLFEPILSTLNLDLYYDSIDSLINMNFQEIERNSFIVFQKNMLFSHYSFYDILQELEKENKPEQNNSKFELRPALSKELKLSTLGELRMIIVKSLEYKYPDQIYTYCGLDSLDTKLKRFFRFNFSKRDMIFIVSRFYSKNYEYRKFITCDCRWTLILIFADPSFLETCCYLLDPLINDMRKQRFADDQYLILDESSSIIKNSYLKLSELCFHKNVKSSIKFLLYKHFTAISNFASVVIVAIIVNIISRLID